MAGTVATTQALDRNTMLPVNMLGSQIGFAQAESKGATTSGGDKVTDTVSNGTEQAQTGTRAVTNQLNAPPAVIEALNQMIKQLSDRPAISNAELDKTAPLPELRFVGNGWVAVDPLTGRTYDAYGNDSQLIKLRADRMAQREKMTKDAGVIQGGTEQQKQTNADRQTEIQRDRAQQDKYSKDAAFSDANFLINKAIADALQQAMPGITAASEGAGTSKSSMSALLQEKAAIKGATEGGALGAQLAVQYGGISNQLSATLEALTKQDPNSPAALLLQALQAGKGMITSGVTSSNQSATTQKSGTAQAVEQTSPQSSYSATDTTRTPITPAQVRSAVTPAVAAKPASNPDSFYAFAEGSNGANWPSINSPYAFDTNTSLPTAYGAYDGGV